MKKRGGVCLRAASNSSANRLVFALPAATCLIFDSSFSKVAPALGLDPLEIRSRASCNIPPSASARTARAASSEITSHANFDHQNLYYGVVTRRDRARCRFELRPSAAAPGQSERRL